MNNSKENFTNTVKDAEKAIADYSSEASEKFEELKSKATTAKCKLEEHISDNPWKSVYISAFIGAVLGFFI